jgi:hypothetical protein
MFSTEYSDSIGVTTTVLDVEPEQQFYLQHHR